MSGRLLELISRIHLDWKRHVARGLAPYGIGPKQIFLLRKLQEGGELAPSAVALLIHGDRPSTTSMLDTMERAGWIRRRRDPGNGKRVLVRLTDAGRQKLEAVPAALWRSARMPLDPEQGLEPEERAALLGLLEKLHGWMDGHLPKD
jgi:DNA-binding MarR family transcriptional regulator